MILVLWRIHASFLSVFDIDRFVCINACGAEFCHWQGIEEVMYSMGKEHSMQVVCLYRARSREGHFCSE